MSLSSRIVITRHPRLTLGTPALASMDERGNLRWILSGTLSSVVLLYCVVVDLCILRYSVFDLYISPYQPYPGSLTEH